MEAAVSSFFTGVTEPLKFAFMFLAPALFGIHALLTGISMAVVAGVIRPSKTAVQVIIGTKVQFVADELDSLCQ